MKKKILILGSIVAVVIIVLASFTSMGSAKSIETNDGYSSIFQRIKNRITDSSWEPGEFLLDMIVFIFILIYLLLGGWGAP